MQKLFVSPMLVEVESFQEVLEQEGIPCMIKNQQGSSLAGEVPFAEVFPELWVINNNDYSDAQEFLEHWRKVQPTEAILGRHYRRALSLRLRAFLFEVTFADPSKARKD